MVTVRKMDVMVFLVTALALGTPFVCARRDLLESSGPSLPDSLRNAITGETVTLVDIPSLKITMTTEASNNKVPTRSSFLSGESAAPSITITDKIKGTWLQPVTISSTTELPSDIISTIVQKLQGGSGSARTKSLAAADDDDDVDIDVPDVDVSKSSTTTHTFSIPSLNIPVPRFPFPFGSPSPLPPPRREISSPSPPPPPHKTPNPPPKSSDSESEKRSHAPPPSHKSSDATSSEGSDENVRN